MPETPAIIRKTVRLPADLADEVEQAAADDDRDFSAQTRVALREHLERRSAQTSDLGSSTA